MRVSQERAALALFISDVPDDDPAVIGSGVLGPRPGEERDDVERAVIASIEVLMRAVRSQAAGLKVSIAPRRFAQDAERLAVRFAHELHLGREAVKVWGGESVVRLPPTRVVVDATSTSRWPLHVSSRDRTSCFCLRWARTGPTATPTAPERWWMARPALASR